MVVLRSDCWSAQVGKGKVVKVTGIENPGRSATVLLRGSNKLVLEVTSILSACKPKAAVCMSRPSPVTACATASPYENLAAQFTDHPRG